MEMIVYWISFKIWSCLEFVYAKYAQKYQGESILGNAISFAPSKKIFLNFVKSHFFFPFTQLIIFVLIPFMNSTLDGFYLLSEYKRKIQLANTPCGTAKYCKIEMIKWKVNVSHAYLGKIRKLSSTCFWEPFNTVTYCKH